MTHNSSMLGWKTDQFICTFTLSNRFSSIPDFSQNFTISTNETESIGSIRTFPSWFNSGVYMKVMTS